MKGNYLGIKVVVAPTVSLFRYICEKLDISTDSVKYVSLAEMDTGLVGYTDKAIYPDMYSRKRPKLLCQVCNGMGFMMNRFSYRQTTCTACNGNRYIESSSQNPQYTVKQVEGKWWVIDPEGKQHSSPSAKEGGAQSLAVVLSHEPQHHCPVCNDYLALSEMVEHMFWLHGISKNGEPESD